MNITQENFEEIKFMIQKMFIDIEDTDDTNANLENLIKIHKKNGTDIIIDGKLPQNKETAKVFFEIIREATTNAIRHAGSSKVFVNIKETLEKNITSQENENTKLVKTRRHEGGLVKVENRAIAKRPERAK